MNDGNLAIDRAFKHNKSFLAHEIIKLIQEHKAALETLAPHKSLMKLYRQKIEDLD
jgi:hypothetical protein